MIRDFAFNEGRSLLPEEVARITIPQWIALGGKSQQKGRGKIQSQADMMRVIAEMEAAQKPESLLEQGEKQLKRYRKREGL